MSGRRGAGPQAVAAAQQIEQLKKEGEQARLDASVARREANARATELAAAKAQIEEFRRKTSQAHYDVAMARRDLAEQADQLAAADERIGQFQAEAAQAQFSEQAALSAASQLAQQVVEAEEKIEKLRARLSSRKSASSTETRRYPAQLEQAREHARAASDRADAWCQQAATLRETLDQTTAELTRLQQELRQKEALLMQSYEHSSVLEAQRQRLAAERTASLARHPQIHETPRRQRMTERAAFSSILAVPTPDESLNDLTWRMYIAPLRGQARRAAETIEHRRRVLSAAAAQEMQHWSDSLRDLESRGYCAEDDPLVRQKVQEILAEQEYAREQNVRGHHGQALRLPPSADFVRIATVCAIQTRQIYMMNASARGRGDVYWQEDDIRLDEASEEELLRSVTSAYFEWRQKLYRSR